jgi:alpha-tubulin suppressor-like RCC1 family protein
MALIRRSLLFLLLVSLFSLTGWKPALASEMPIQVQIDGRPLKAYPAPQLREGVTLVPLRAIFEALGAQVRWDLATRTVTATRGQTVVQLTINAPTATKNGQAITLAHPPVLVDGYTMVPLRFVAEALGASVAWDGTARRVSIESPRNPGAPVTAVGAGAYHSLVVKGGEAWAWGANEQRQVFYDRSWQELRPIFLPNLQDLVAVAGSRAGSIALRADGTVWTWGESGQRDHVEYNTSSTPGEVGYVAQKLDLPPAKAIAAGNEHFVVLAQDGSVWTWSTAYKDPYAVEGLGEIRAIAASDGYTAAVDADGRVWFWYFDQPPVQVDGLRAVASVTLWSSLLFAIHQDGRLAYQDFGHDAIPLPDLPGAVALAIPRNHPDVLYALRSDGTVWSLPWMEMHQGWTQVAGLSGVTGIAAGWDHVVAGQADGTVWTWGQNGKGQLGDGTQTDQASPVRVVFR